MFATCLALLFILRIHLGSNVNILNNVYSTYIMLLTHCCCNVCRLCGLGLEVNGDNYWCKLHLFGSQIRRKRKDVSGRFSVVLSNTSCCHYHSTRCCRTPCNKLLWMALYEISKEITMSENPTLTLYAHACCPCPIHSDDLIVIYHKDKPKRRHSFAFPQRYVFTPVANYDWSYTSNVMVNEIRWIEHSVSLYNFIRYY